MKKRNEKQSVALLSIVASIFLIIGKAAVGLITGSLALLTDALHSFLDLSASVITLFAVRLSDKPADREHHFGHGKVESLAALFEVLLLLLTCIYIGYEAVGRLIEGAPPPRLNIWAYLVIVAAIVIDISRVRALKRVAKKYSSQALAADALNFSTDILSSIVVLIGLVAIQLGIEWGDSVAALGVAVFILIATLRMGKQAVDVLLDRAPVELENSIRKLVRQFPEILSIESLRLRTDGRTTFGALRLNIDRSLTFSLVDRTKKKIQDELRRRLPRADITLTVNPASKESERVAETVRFVVSTFNYPLHHLIVNQTDNGYFVSMHIEMPGDISLDRAHDKSEEIKRKLQQAVPDLKRAVIHTQPYEHEVYGRLGADEHIARIRTEASDLIKAFSGVDDCHDIVLTPFRDGLALSADIHLDGRLSLDETHQIARDVEDKLRAEIVELVSVTLHLEPMQE